MLGSSGQVRRDGARYDLAERQAGGRRIGTQIADHVARDLERDRHRGFANWDCMPDRLGFLEISIRLTSR